MMTDEIQEILDEDGEIDESKLPNGWSLKESKVQKTEFGNNRN